MFGTSGIRGPVGQTVTAAVALRVGRALASEGYEHVVVGRDARQSGTMLVDALAAGIQECGGTVVDVGVTSTPAVARGVDWYDADAGVSVTASHNPPEDNGIKLWTQSGRAFGPERQAAIETRMAEGTFSLAAWDGIGNRRTERGIEDRHLAALLEATALDRSIPTAVDVGNGTGGVTARALEALGCPVRTLNAQRDGAFPGRPSEPTAETLADLRTFVRETEATVGIAHDGDADRMLAVDDRGRFVPKDVLLAIFAREAAGSGDRVAVPVDTSLAVDDALETVGATATRTPVGDVFVAARAAEPDVVFGGEPSGAWIWPEETFCPDGPLAACRLLELVAADGPLSTLVDEVATYPIRRDSVRTAEKAAVMDHLEERVLERFDGVETLDGLRVELDDGWFLLRPSGTEPKVRITAEGRTEAAVDDIFEEARHLVDRAI